MGAGTAETRWERTGAGTGEEPGDGEARARPFLPVTTPYFRLLFGL
jgi:hypothetical protein